MGELRVSQIHLEKLFRQYDHHIRLRAEDRVTVLHGKNGVGKTVTLSLVAALLKGNYLSLMDIPFERLRVEFTDQSYIEARPNAGSGKPAAPQQQKIKGQDESGPRLVIEYSTDGGPTKSVIFPNKMLNRISTGRSDFDRTENTSVEPLPDRLSEDYLWHELAQAAGRALSMTSFYKAKEPAELEMLRKRVPVHFIEAQRLFKITQQLPSSHPGHDVPGRDRKPAVTSVVNEVSEEMAARVSETDSAYRATSTRLDDSLPSRLFTTSGKSAAMPVGELERRTDSLEKERQRLRSIGLLANPTSSFDPHALNDTMQAMFGVYLQDNEEKLGVFRDLADRAEILLSILNRKFTPKHIRLDKDLGYQVTSHDGQPLKLDSLSSGEQHELVLLHNLLFRVEAGALLLIDEPELSLHVTWQSEFLEDLLRIAAKVGFDALVATHSPYIVGGRRDLMEQLGDPA